MKKLFNRIKTLYWFWKMTREWVDSDGWYIETGKQPTVKYPEGTKWLTIHTPDEYFLANRVRDKIT